MQTWIHIDKRTGIDVISVWIDTPHTGEAWPTLPWCQLFEYQTGSYVHTTIRPLVCQTNEARLPVISAPASASLCFLYGRAYGKRCHKRKWSARHSGARGCAPSGRQEIKSLAEAKMKTNQHSVRTQGRTWQSLFWPVLTSPQEENNRLGCAKCLKKYLMDALTYLHD